MKVSIRVECECGNDDTILIRQEKEFECYDYLTSELAIQESITDSGSFKSYQSHPEAFYIKCMDCNKEVTLI